jgi:uncharacterized protein
MPDIARLTAKPKHKLLALDGGGIRGVISLEVLLRLESFLRTRHGNADLVLADEFDYIAGTSTGAIIAACLSIGMPVREIRDFYRRCGADMFEEASLLRRLRYKYEDEPLAIKLREVLGERTTLGSDSLRTLLMVVLRNATTDSPWPLSSNPAAMFNQPGAECNLTFPLWQLVRASTAAPTYFPPEVIAVGGQMFIFVDGGVTIFNNPAWQLFLMATNDRYRLNWPADRNSMLLVSVGTGTAANAKPDLKASQMHLLHHATTIPGALMNAAAEEQDSNCRIFGDCRFGLKINLEVDDFRGSAGPLPASGKLFTYLRYDPDVSRGGLDGLGLSNVNERHIAEMDSVDHLDEMTRVGAAFAAKHLTDDALDEHFRGFA